MSEVLKIILSLSLSGTLLFFILLVLKPLYKHKLSRVWQYYIWLVVIARMITPFTPEATLVGSAFAYFDNIKVEITQSVPHSNGEQSGIIADADEIMPSTEPQAQNPAINATPPPPVQNIFANVYENLWVLWAAIAFALLIRKFTIYQSFVRFVKAGRAEVSDTEILNLLADAGEAIGVKRPVELFTNPIVSSPMLLGFFRPYIILPSIELEGTELAYIMRHELTHYKRLDMFYKWLVQITVCLHWFNPFAYLLAKEVNKCCELSCDEAIIRKMASDEKKAYGDTLLNSLKTMGDYNDKLATITLTEGAEQLIERLEAIMKFKKKSIAVVATTLALTSMLCIGAGAVGAYATPTATHKGNAIDTALTSSEVVQEGGVYYIFCDGADESNKPNSSVTEGSVQFVLVRKSSYASIGPFNGTEQLVNEVTAQCDYMLQKQSITQSEATLIIAVAKETAAITNPASYVIKCVSEKVILKQGGTAFKIEVDPASQNNYIISDNTNVPVGERNYRFNKWDVVVERKQVLDTSAVFSSTITLTIPENLDRPALYLQTVSGDIHIENLHNVNLTVESESGNVYSTDTSTDYISAKSNNGNIKLTNVTSTGDIELCSDIGSVEVQLSNSNRSYAVKVSTAPTSNIVIDSKSYAGGDYTIGDGKQTITLNGQNNAFSLSNIRLFQEDVYYWAEAEFLSFLQEQKQAYKELLTSGDITQAEYDVYISTNEAILKDIHNGKKVSKSATGNIENGTSAVTINGQLFATEKENTVNSNQTGTVALNLSSEGQNSIHHSSSFEAKANQTLVLDIQSSITGGAVDFFLFSPNGKEQRITIGGSDKTETVALTAGRWAYNCTGFFDSGAVTIKGQLYATELDKKMFSVEADNKYEEYKKFGLLYNTDKERFYYDGKLVRYFEDIYSGDYTPNKRMTIAAYKDGEIDVHTLSDENGVITGVEVYDQAGFDANTKKLADPMAQFSDNAKELVISFDIDNGGVVILPSPTNEIKASYDKEYYDVDIANKNGRYNISVSGKVAMMGKTDDVQLYVPTVKCTMDVNVLNGNFTYALPENCADEISITAQNAGIDFSSKNKYKNSAISLKATNKDFVTYQPPVYPSYFNKTDTGFEYNNGTGKNKISISLIGYTGVNFND